MNQNKREIILPVSVEEYLRSHRLDELKEYLNVTEKYLKNAKEDFEVRSNEHIKQLSDEDRQEFDDFLNYTYEQYSETFPRILRSSFFVSAISLFENEIDQISKKIKREQKIPINISDLNGNLFTKLKLYCKLAELPMSFDNPTWNTINNYYTLRNCIVHNNGFISGWRDEQKILPYVKKKNIVDELIFFPSIRPTKVIALSEQFCKEVLETMQSFIVELEKKIDRKRTKS